MAQYKVPQDVEADDKLLGPFTFRQFVYLMIMGGSIALAVALFQIFPFLALIPVPFAIFFAVLALPLKKDQPMETYLAAIVSFHLKPKNRFWNPGQRESTILITAPKVIEQPRARDITGEEASTRLSFLANIVDTEGNSLRSSVASPMQPEFVAEANAIEDMMDVSSPTIRQAMSEQESRRAEIVNQMREAFAAKEAEQNQRTPHQLGGAPLRTIEPLSKPKNDNPFLSPSVVKPEPEAKPKPDQEPRKETPAAAIEKALEEEEERKENQPNPRQAQEQAKKDRASRNRSDLPDPADLPPVEEDPEEIRRLAEIDPLNSPVVITPDLSALRRAATNKAKLAELAHDQDLSVATIAKEANRIEKESKKDKEVYISLH